jgi:CHAT domain-containing protein
MSRTSPERALDRLAQLGAALNRSLLGEAARHLGDGEVIIVPPGRLHAVPWPMLTDLRDRVFTVAPSATLWLRARAGNRQGAGSGTKHPAAESRDGGDVVLVHGPGLSTAEAEVPLLAAQYAGDPGVEVLGGGTATAARVLAAIDGARLAHIAAHGIFRADSPLFSALQLDDGPLTVYDLERLRRAPRQIVLSSCDSAVAAAAGTDELLGLASALIPLGTTGIVASVVPVNDTAVMHLMAVLHQHLRSGASLAEATQKTRIGMQSEPMEAATSLSFLSLGTG